MSGPDNHNARLVLAIAWSSLARVPDDPRKMRRLQLRRPSFRTIRTEE
jgi:hypothetical protein